MTSLDQLLTTDELAAYLHLPVATLYAWRHGRQDPPSFRVGRHVRCRSNDVERWITSRLEQAPVAANEKGGGRP